MHMPYKQVDVSVQDAFSRCRILMHEADADYRCIKYDATMQGQWASDADTRRYYTRCRLSLHDENDSIGCDNSTTATSTSTPLSS